MSLVTALKPWFSQRVSRWLDRRMPAVSEVSLNRKNIFILPTGPGLLFLTATSLIFITAINYVLSLAFGLAFLMTSLFILCILHTFRNLQHLRIRGAGAEPVFAGEEAAFVFVLQRNASQSHEMLELRFANGNWSYADLFDKEQERVKVYLPTKQRGVLRAPRVTVQTRFPLGLWRAWSYVDLDMEVVVYPKPLPGPMPNSTGGSSSGETSKVQAGVEDFHGLRNYSAGDSPKQIAWKNLARGQGLKVKQFVEAQDEHLLLDWAQFVGLDPEQRLSRLCYCVLDLTHRDVDFAMHLPGVEIALGKGDAHCKKALRALALWNTEGA